MTKTLELNNCLSTAKTNYDSLWEANQDKNKRVDNDNVKWIEDIYKQEEIF